MQNKKSKTKTGGEKTPLFIPFYLKEKNGFKAKTFEEAKKEWKEKFKTLKNMKTEIKKETKEYKYLSSYKSYPVRSEDEEGFRKLALEEWRKQTGIKGVGKFDQALSQGIEIPSERVEIRKLPTGEVDLSEQNHIGYIHKEYATLLTEDKEEEGQGDAVEFAEWLSESRFVVLSQHSNALKWVLNKD